MMISGFGVRHETLNERNSRGKTVERELLADSAAFERPTLEFVQLPLNILLRQNGHVSYSPNRRGDTAASSGSSRLSRIKSATALAVNGASRIPFRKCPVASTTSGM